MESWNQDLIRLFKSFNNESNVMLYKVKLIKTKIGKSVEERQMELKMKRKAEKQYRLKCEQVNNETAPLILADGQTKYFLFSI